MAINYEKTAKSWSDFFNIKVTEREVRLALQLVQYQRGKPQPAEAAECSKPLDEFLRHRRSVTTDQVAVYLGYPSKGYGQAVKRVIGAALLGRGWKRTVRNAQKIWIPGFELGKSMQGALAGGPHTDEGDGTEGAED